MDVLCRSGAICPFELRNADAAWGAIESAAAQLRSITSQAICSADLLLGNALNLCGFLKKANGRRRKKKEIVLFFVTTFVL